MCSKSYQDTYNEYLPIVAGLVAGTYKCRVCMFPVDRNGVPLDIDNDAANAYLIKHRDTIIGVATNHCCEDKCHE